MKRLIPLLLLFLLGSLPVAAQMYFKEGRQICCGDSLLAGNAQALEINPSQLGRVGGKKFSLGLLQIGSNVYSNRLQLGDALTFAFSDDSLSGQLKDRLLVPAGAEPFTFNSNFDFNWVSFSFATPGLGGIGIRLKDRISSYSTVPNELMAMLLQGRESEYYQNNSTDNLIAATNGTRINYSHIRELSIGYGRSFLRSDILNLYAGGTVKRLWGVGYFNTSINGDIISGLSAFSDFYNINYGALDPKGTNLDDFQRKLLSSAGAGWGYDLGVTAEIAQRFVIGASVMDIGSLTWDKGLVSASDSVKRFLEKLNDPTVRTLDFKEQLGTIYEDFNFGEGEAFEVPLNTQLRLNASWKAGQRFSLNTDVLIPMKNNNTEALNYQSGTYALGFNYMLLNGKVRMNVSSAAFYSQDYEFRVPLGISFGARGGTMFSISATDLITFVNKDKAPFAGISITGLNLLF